MKRKSAIDCVTLPLRPFSLAFSFSIRSHVFSVPLEPPLSILPSLAAFSFCRLFAFSSLTCFPLFLLPRPIFDRSVLRFLSSLLFQPRNVAAHFASSPCSLFPPVPCLGCHDPFHTPHRLFLTRQCECRYFPFFNSLSPRISSFLIGPILFGSFQPISRLSFLCSFPSLAPFFLPRISFSTLFFVFHWYRELIS